MNAPHTDDEQERLTCLRACDILDTDAEDTYDDIVRLAAFICGTPLAAVSLVDADRQWFKAALGLALRETPRADSFCAHAILEPDALLVVPDAQADPRFADNPLVTGGPGIRFYAGAPLVTGDGHALGALCVKDRVPRALAPEQEAALRTLARQVTAQMELARRAAALHRSEAKFRGMIDASPVPFCLNDERQNVTFLNAAFVQTFGYTQADIPTLADWWPRAYPDPEYRRWVAVTWQARLGRAAREGAAFEPLEVDVRCKDGTTRTVVADAAALEPGFRGQHLVILYDVTERRRQEGELRQLGEAVASTTEGVTVADARHPDLPLTYVNPAFLSLTGHAAHEVIGHSCRFLQGAETDPDAKRQIRQALDAGRSCRVTLRNYRKDGSAFWNELTLAPVHDAAGALTHFVGVQHDVTALKETEDALRRSAERLVEAQHIGGIGDWELDVATGRLTWSAEVFRLMEFGPAQDAPHIDVVRARYHPADLPTRDRLFTRALETGEPYQCDLRLCLPSGTPRWCHLVGRPVRDASGRVARVVGTAQDITERQQAQEEQARLADYNRLLLESTAEGIYGMDRGGRCTFINAAGARLLGHAAAEVIGRDMHSLIHHSHTDGSPYPVADCPIYRAIQQGVSCHVEAEVLWRRDGTPFSAEYSSFPLRDEGSIIGAVVTFSDITERVQAEQRVRDANTVLSVQKAQLEAANADLEALATTDPLTGLLNHRAFQQRLAELTAQAGREGADLAVAVLDLDGFRYFNDVYGTVIGDSVLRRVTAHLRAACGAGDALARFGGDEFTLLLPAAAGTARADVEARLRAALAGLAYLPPGGGTAIPITASLGVALFPQDGLDRAAVVQQAEERLRLAKTGGAAEADEVRTAMFGSVEGFSMLDALVTAVDNKDRYTRRHSEDVMDYGLQIARALGLGDRERHTVAVAALLHDVGKIGVPDAVLRKPGRLTDKEFGAVRQHPMMGAIMVGAVPGLEDTLDAVRHHHERWDGAGYPFGLRGEETPLIARLMAVADAFSAMTTDRPYRRGMGRGEALAILEGGAGAQWDPRCVAAFLSAQRDALARAA